MADLAPRADLRNQIPDQIKDIESTTDHGRLLATLEQLLAVQAL